MPPIRVPWKATLAEPLVRARRRSRPARRAARRRDVQDPLKLYVAPDRRRAAADTGGGARARAAQGRGRRGREAAADRVQPPARDVDHPQLHAGRRPAPRPDPGGQPRPDPRGREVRLHARLQALDVRDLVDPAVDLARARRAGPHDPAPRARRRPGAPRHPGTPDARPEARTATRRSTRSRHEADFTPRARRRLCSSSSRTTSRSRRRSATARA